MKKEAVMKQSTLAMLALAVPLSHAAFAQDAQSDAADDFAKAKQAQELRQLELGTEKLEIEVRNDRRKSLTDAFPASPTTGTTTVEGEAGKLEAAGLSAVAVNALARKVALDAQAAARRSTLDPAPRGELDPCGLLLDESGLSVLEKLSDAESETSGDGPGSLLEQHASQPERANGPVATSLPPVLLLPGADTVGFAAWEQFRFRQCAVSSAFDDALEEGGALAPSQPTKGSTKFFSGGLAGIGTAVSVGSKLLQLVTPDWEVGGIAATVPEKAFLAAVAREYVQVGGGRVYWAGQVSKSGGGDEVFGRLAQLDVKDRQAAALLVTLEPKLAQATKAKNRRVIESHAGPIAALKQARAAYSALLASMAGKEGESALPINRVVTEAAAATLLGRDGVVLNLNVGASGGGYYSRKVIWNALGLGGPPFFVSGGTTVHYVAVRPADQQILGGGQLACIAGYVKINRVAALANDSRSDRVRCR
jgi:hypothetical protein